MQQGAGLLQLHWLWAAPRDRWRHSLLRRMAPVWPRTALQRTASCEPFAARAQDRWGLAVLASEVSGWGTNSSWPFSLEISFYSLGDRHMVQNSLSTKSNRAKNLSPPHLPAIHCLSPGAVAASTSFLSILPEMARRYTFHSRFFHTHNSILYTLFCTLCFS